VHPLVANKRVDRYDIDITRSGKWGNPFVIGVNGSRSECIEQFRNWLIFNGTLVRDIAELTGKRLGCVCAPKSCHGEVLAQMANNPFTLKAYADKRVVITGSRHWRNEDQIRKRLVLLGDRCVIGHGKAPDGADEIAGRVADTLGLRVIEYPVTTKIDGPWPAAGCRRNTRMLIAHNPSLVIAFRAAGKSNGTDDCIRSARSMGIEVDLVHERY
jgi:hypothetical protein